MVTCELVTRCDLKTGTGWLNIYTTQCIGGVSIPVKIKYGIGDFAELKWRKHSRLKYIDLTPSTNVTPRQYFSAIRAPMILFEHP
jgi:hypothetical protein